MKFAKELLIASVAFLAGFSLGASDNNAKKIIEDFRKKASHGIESLKEIVQETLSDNKNINKKELENSIKKTFDIVDKKIKKIINKNEQEDLLKNKQIKSRKK